jgi:ParB family chromosome partitioning protein
MPRSTSRLGKGLNALISSREPMERTIPPAPDASGIRELPVDKISPNPRQPRSDFDSASLNELAESIRTTGLLQPIIVRKRDAGWELVAGERRWRAARIAGLASIPAIVREASDAEALELALVENLQREDLGPLERAGAYQHYLEAFGGTVEKLSQRLGESRANISNYLRLLKLHGLVADMLAKGELGMGQARAIASIEDAPQQVLLAKRAVRRNLSVREVEALAREFLEGKRHPGLPPRPAADQQARHFSEVAKALTQKLGLRVKLQAGRRRNSGRVIITFSNLDEFDRIADRLGGTIKID